MSIAPSIASSNVGAIPPPITERPGILKRVVQKIIDVVLRIFDWICFWKTPAPKSSLKLSRTKVQRLNSTLHNLSPAKRFSAGSSIRATSPVAEINPAQLALPKPVVLERKFPPHLEKLHQFLDTFFGLVSECFYEKELEKYLPVFLSLSQQATVWRGTIVSAIISRDTPIFLSLFNRPNGDRIISHELSDLNLEADGVWGWLLFERGRVELGREDQVHLANLDKVGIKGLITSLEGISNLDETIRGPAEKSILLQIRRDLQTDLEGKFDPERHLLVSCTLDFVFNIHSDVHFERDSEVLEESLYFLQECRTSAPAIRSCINRAMEELLKIDLTSQKEIILSSEHNKQYNNRQYEECANKLLNWVIHTNHSEPVSFNGESTLAKVLFQKVLQWLINRKLTHFSRVWIETFSEERGKALFKKTVMQNAHRFSKILSKRAVASIGELPIGELLTSIIDTTTLHVRSIARASAMKETTKVDLDNAAIGVEAEPIDDDEREVKRKYQKLLKDAADAGGNEIYLENKFKSWVGVAFFNKEDELKDYDDRNSKGLKVEEVVIPQLYPIDENTSALFADTVSTLILGTQWVLEEQQPKVEKGEDLLWNQITFPEELNAILKEGKELIGLLAPQIFPSSMIETVAHSIFTWAVTSANQETRKLIEKLLRITTDPHELKNLMTREILPSLAKQLFLIHVKGVFHAQLVRDDSPTWMDSVKPLWGGVVEAKRDDYPTLICKMLRDPEDYPLENLARKLFEDVQSNTRASTLEALEVTRESFFDVVDPWLRGMLADLQLKMPAIGWSADSIKNILTEPSSTIGKGNEVYEELVDHLILGIGKIDKKIESSRLISKGLPWFLRRNLGKISQEMGKSIDHLGQNLIDLSINERTKRALDKNRIRKLLDGEQVAINPEEFKEKSRIIASVINELITFNFNQIPRYISWPGKLVASVSQDSFTPPRDEEILAFIEELHTTIFDRKEMNEHLVYQIQAVVLKELKKAGVAYNQSDEKLAKERAKPLSSHSSK